MGRTRLAKASIKELRKNIEFAKERKKYFEEYLHKLWNSFQKGLISRDFYVETAHKHFQGKTLKQWIDYYETYILECKNKSLYSAVSHFFLIIVQSNRPC